MADIFNQLLQQKEASEKAVLQSSDGGNIGDALIDFNLTASFLEIYGEKKTMPKKMCSQLHVVSPSRKNKFTSKIFSWCQEAKKIRSENNDVHTNRSFDNGRLRLGGLVSDKS